MNTHTLKKIKNLREQNFKGKVAQPTVRGKELTSGQKETSGQQEKPHGKKKKTRAKKITSRQTKRE